MSDPTRAWALTPVQALYLSEGARRHLRRGWGGLRSTLVVRLLEERGLVTVRWSYRHPGWKVTDWEITGLTRRGDEALALWRERHPDRH